MTNKYYYRYFIKNFLSFLAQMWIPLLVMGALSIFIIQEYVTQNINDQNMNILKQTNEMITLIFNELDSLNLYILSSTDQFANLQKIMEKEELTDQDYKDLAFLKNFIDSPDIVRSYIDSIYIYVKNNTDKFLSSTTTALVELESYPDFHWYHSFKTHLGDELIWTEARKMGRIINNQPASPKDIITMYRKIPENNGVLVLNIEAKYIAKQLANLSTLEGQTVLILDDRNNVIFQEESHPLSYRDTRKITNESKTFFPLEINDEHYVISKLKSDQYGWTYVSMAPQGNLYKIPKTLFQIVIMLFVVCIVISSLLAFFFTRLASSKLKSILTIVQAAENGKPLPTMPSRVNDLNSYIVQNILKNFMENNLLKVKLAEQKYKEQTMEYTALHAQLNPHFLYNTLETINWKAIALTGRPNELNTMIENLADILRYSLDDEQKQVSIMEEMKYTNSYIAIQKVRHKDQFEVVWEYPDELNNVLVKKLILQPIVENVLQHALISGVKCYIKIKILKAHDTLEISVIDNGKGMTKNRLIEVKSLLNSNIDQYHHIGLSNTHKRVKLTYGEQYGLTIKSKLHFGTVIRISLPK